MDGRIPTFFLLGGLALAGVAHRNRATGSRGIVRAGTRPAEPESLADRLAKLQSIDRLMFLDEDGVENESIGKQEGALRRWAAPILAGGDGGLVFAKPGARPREGYALLRSAGFPTDGFELRVLDRDPADDSGQDLSLRDAGAYLFHALTKRHLPGGEFVPKDHRLVEWLTR